ncbi:magnesium transporter [Saccharobesus litoralis]|uniref:Magnesium transporter MgtE n=1 Tax=Saccharobesus litoralis TaxID=2172099 RepID=A0A2S0VWQ9_9ALTE|nr:magnesium transporter [Saccharobesus litoralis]AWB68656.1 magnesium transporter [Saccharobesus litoralis]
MQDTFEQDNSQNLLSDISHALSQGMFVHVRNILHEMSDGDIAHVLESSPSKQRHVIWTLIDPEFHGDILEELSEDVRNSIIQKMNPSMVAEATEGLDTDDLAEVLRSLPDETYQAVLQSLDEQDRHRAEKALGYEEDTAGAIMNTDTVTIRPDVTIEVVSRYLRLRGHLPEATDVLYVVDDQDKLLGTLSLAKLVVTSNPATLVSDIMEEEAETIPADMDESEVAKQFERHNWISAPVTNEQGLLLGRITIDDIVDIIREDAEHSMMSMAGLDDEEDTFAPVIKSTQRRSIWLGINLITALLAALVSSAFEDILSQLAVLAVLNTIVPSMGGIAGNQTLTLVIRAMAVGHVAPTNVRWLIIKEFTIGLLNGVLWAVLIASVVALWKQDLLLGGIIAFAMLMNMLAAGIAGVSIPLILKRLEIDPALAGGVILTTVTDVVGIFAFLGTATWLLSA